MIRAEFVMSVNWNNWEVAWSAAYCHWWSYLWINVCHRYTELLWTFVSISKIWLFFAENMTTSRVSSIFRHSVCIGFRMVSNNSWTNSTAPSNNKVLVSITLWSETRNNWPQWCCRHAHRTDRSTVFARWRQCAPHLLHSLLDPYEFHDAFDGYKHVK